MALKEQLQSDIKTAMKAKDRDRLTTLRMLMAAIKQIEVDERIELDDARITQVFTKEIKRRRDAMSQYQQADRPELAAKEESEAEIISTYLPEQLSADKLLVLVQAAISASGAEGMRDMGKVMGVLKPQVEGSADMTQVSALVKAQLAG